MNRNLSKKEQQDENLVLEEEIIRLSRLLRTYRYSLLYLVVMVTIAVIIQLILFLR